MQNQQNIQNKEELHTLETFFILDVLWKRVKVVPTHKSNRMKAFECDQFSGKLG